MYLGYGIFKKNVVFRKLRLSSASYGKSDTGIVFSEKFYVGNHILDIFFAQIGPSIGKKRTKCFKNGKKS